MPTLLLRLAGPMQSWGTTSRFAQRDTGKEPSKSGVLGLLAAALGIDRGDWDSLQPLTRLNMGVRHDRPGMLKYDYQTAGCAAGDNMIKANRAPSKDGLPSRRDYLADAIFLVGLEGEDNALLERVNAALLNPVWPLSLGRKSYVPSEPVSLPDGIAKTLLREALASYPWLSSKRKWEGEPERLLISIESSDHSGLLTMDQPLSSFAERHFGARFVRSEWIPFPREAQNATA